MTQKLREQVSALMDQELPEGEHELLLRRFSVEKRLRLHWERYHLIGEAMRKGLPAADTRGLADRVMAALDTQSQPAAAPQPKPINPFLRGIAGMAVAASVAVVALVGLKHGMHTAGPVPAEIVPAGGVAAAPQGGDLLSAAAGSEATQPTQAYMHYSLVGQADNDVPLSSGDTGQGQRHAKRQGAKSGKTTGTDSAPPR